MKSKTIQQAIEKQENGDKNKFIYCMLLEDLFFLIGKKS